MTSDIPLNTTGADGEPALQFRQTISKNDRDKHGDLVCVLAVLQQGVKMIAEQGGDITRMEARVTQQVSDLLLVEAIAAIK